MIGSGVRSALLMPKAIAPCFSALMLAVDRDDRFSCCLNFGKVDFEEDGAIVKNPLRIAGRVFVIMPVNKNYLSGLAGRVRRSRSTSPPSRPSFISIKPLKSDLMTDKATAPRTKGVRKM